MITILTLYLLPLLPLLYYLLPYFLDPLKLRRFPSPFPAAFTNLWLFYQCRHGRRHHAVHAAHQQHGRFVRVQPDHVSIADPAAIAIVYGHGTGFLKSPYYDAFVSLRPGLFNTRSRAAHSRKRKTISHAFSAKAILQFEEYMRDNLGVLVAQWNRLCENGRDGGVVINALHWFNYLAFDIISDLTFGSRFGMLTSARDEALVKNPFTGAITSAPAIDVLNKRGEVSATIGCMPWLKPYAKYLPDRFFSDGIKAVENLAGIAVAKVAERLDQGKGEGRQDLLAKLMEGRDEEGKKLERKEIEAEALTMLIAGSDTTSNTLCALLYWVLRAPGLQEKLQAEVDSVPSEDPIPSYMSIKDLPLLRATINETLRIHSTSSLGLPRLVPSSGATVCDTFFEGGTVLSVPSWTLHHSAEIWGEDVDEFRPERWHAVTDLQKDSFIPFSTGPRACVGRNVAEMEMIVIVAAVFRNWSFYNVGEVPELECREGFLRKPLGYTVGMRKRAVPA